MTAVDGPAGQAAGVVSAEAVVEAAETRHVCANCETAAPRRYCPECGQRAHLPTRLSHLLEEFAEGIAHFDGRLWRTLPLLALRPGRLSREWREGRRARHVPPLHLFLFAVFAFFMIDAIDLPGEPAHRQQHSTNEAVVRREPRPERKSAASSGLEAVSAWMKGVTAKLDTEDGDYYAYKANSLYYKLAPGLIPISVGILWLLLARRRGLTLYDHVVVALYGLGAATLALTIAFLVGHFAGAWVWYPFWALMFAHALLHLRGAYGLSWPGSVLRTLALGGLTAVLFFVFFLAILSLAVSG